LERGPGFLNHKESAMTTATTHALTAEQIAFYRREGYLIVRGLFSQSEVDEIRRRFDAVAAGPAVPEHWYPDLSEEGSKDPLKRYPRVMMPHRFDAMTKRYLLEPRVLNVLRDLLEDEPLAAQSMFYFKPSGSRGQALHQDDFYLRTQGGDCLAAWIAIDPSTPENGGLRVAPGTHRDAIHCPRQADSRESFTTEYVEPAPGHDPVPAVLAPGDVLFFNGRVIHGSTPNNHPTMWRRSLINHYVPASATGVSQWYFPLLGRDGGVVERPGSTLGGPCGTEEKTAGYAP